MPAGFESHTKNAHRHSYCNRKRVIDFLKSNTFLFAVKTCVLIRLQHPPGMRAVRKSSLATVPGVPGARPGNCAGPSRNFPEFSLARRVCSMLFIEGW